jgi:hypothetical protein
MEANIFFKNGDVSEPRLNANGEGAFKTDFRGDFADEKKMNMYGVKREEKFNLTTDDILNRVKGTASNVQDKASEGLGDIANALKGEDTKISTGTWVAIGLVSVVVLGGLGYILYKKYK